MADIPFNIVLTGTITGSGSLELSYQAPTNQEVTLKNLLHVSTSTFNVTDITDSEGQRYTNASVANPIPNTMLKDVADDFHGINPFQVPIILTGGRSINIALLDTSTSSNPVTIVIEALRKTP